MVTAWTFASVASFTPTSFATDLSVISDSNTIILNFAKKQFIVFILSQCHSVTDVLWISTTLFAAVYSSFEDGDCPKFLLISTPVSHFMLFCHCFFRELGDEAVI